MTLADLAVPGTPEIHFEPEERPLLVVTRAGSPSARGSRTS